MTDTDFEVTSIVLPPALIATTALTGPQGVPGPTGPPGAGVPTGGTVSQVLAKRSATNYDTVWNDVPINPLNYGCAGDGTTDDSANFQLAVNAWKAVARSGNQRVKFLMPSGYNFRLTKTIDCTGIGGFSAEFCGEGIGATRITPALTEAYPVLDFSGSGRVNVHGFYMNATAGSQTCAILFARAQSNSNGDNGRPHHLLIDGPYTQCVLAFISADLSAVRDVQMASATTPVSIFVGATDVLGVGSKYQTFATVTGNTIFTLDNCSIGPSSRSGCLFSGGARYFLRSVYCNLAGTAAHAIELIGSGGQSVNGDIRVESTSTAASQDVLYVNSTGNPTTGNLMGDWPMNGSTDVAVIRFAGSQTVASYWFNGNWSNTAAGTVKFAAGSGGTLSDCVIWNRGNRTSDPAVTITKSVVYDGATLHVPTYMTPDAAQLWLRRLAGGDVNFQLGGDGQTGDTFLRLYRGGGLTESIKIMAAAAGGGGLNNQYTSDMVTSSVAADRAWNWRRSTDGGTTFATFLRMLAAGSVAVGISNPGAAATDGFPYIPASAGAPSGVPTAQAGFVPMYYDTTNHKIWIYDAGWKGVVVA